MSYVEASPERALAGFLYDEGLVQTTADISGISYCVDKDHDETQLFSIVNVKLRSGFVPDLRPLERHFYTSSSCGVCGKRYGKRVVAMGQVPLVPALREGGDLGAPMSHHNLAVAFGPYLASCRPMVQDIQPLRGGGRI